MEASGSKREEGDEEGGSGGKERGEIGRGGDGWWRGEGRVVNLMYLISFAVSESSGGWSNSGSKERAGEQGKKSRLMQQNKGAVSLRWLQLQFLHRLYFSLRSHLSIISRCSSQITFINAWKSEWDMRALTRVFFCPRELSHAVGMDLRPDMLTFADDSKMFLNDKIW